MRLAEAYRLIGELTARAGLSAQAERLPAVAEDSSTSSRPQSCDNPYRKKGSGGSLREPGETAAG